MLRSRKRSTSDRQTAKGGGPAPRTGTTRSWGEMPELALVDAPVVFELPVSVGVLDLSLGETDPQRMRVMGDVVAAAVQAAGASLQSRVPVREVAFHRGHDRMPWLHAVAHVKAGLPADAYAPAAAVADRALQQTLAVGLAEAGLGYGMRIESSPQRWELAGVVEHLGSLDPHAAPPCPELGEALYPSEWPESWYPRLSMFSRDDLQTRLGPAPQTEYGPERS